MPRMLLRIVFLQVSLFILILECFQLNAVGADIKVSPSGHYFTYHGKTRMLLGESATQCPMQNLNFNYNAWVNRLALENHSTAHIWAFIAPRQIRDNIQIESRWGYVYPGITPWKRKSSGPNAYDGNKQWDLFSFDDGIDPNKNYWPRLKDICQKLQSQNMLLGISVFFGWPKLYEDILFHPFYTLNGGHATCREDITFISDPGKEIHSETWNDSWPPRKKSQWLWEKFALKLIQETSSCDNVWFDFRDEWSYNNETNLEGHFRDFFKRRGQIWADTTPYADFRTANPDVPPFGKTPTMKTEGEPYDDNGVRNDVWMLATSSIHFVLHNDARPNGVSGWDAKTALIKKIDINKDLGRKYVGLASKFFNQFVKDLDSMLPSNHLVTGGSCLAAKKKEYVVYLELGGQVQLNLLDATNIKFNAKWYNTSNGHSEFDRVVTGGSLQTFNAPSSEPWVLHVVSQEIDDSEPLAPYALSILISDD